MKNKCWASCVRTHSSTWTHEPSGDGHLVVPGTRTCPKIRHSCIRKVISFFNNPIRKLCRPIHRATQGLLETLSSYELRALKDLFSVIRERVLPLNNDLQHKSTCMKCGKTKKDVTSGSLDADAFYEQVAPEDSIKALYELTTELSEETGHQQIAVRKSQPMTTKLGGQKVDRRSFFPMKATTWVFAFVELLIFYSMIISVNLVHMLGSIWLLPPGQTSIGNPFGRIAVALVSGREKRRYDRGWSLRTAGTPLGAFQRHEIIAFVKYVDDLYYCTFVLCQECAKLILPDVYSFNMSPATEGDNPKFLDVLVRVKHDKSIFLTPVIHNNTFLAGEGGPRERSSIPPWWAPLSITVLAGIFTGSLVRWRSVTKDQNRIRILAWRRTTALITLGYTFTALRAAWRKVRDLRDAPTHHPVSWRSPDPEPLPRPMHLGAICGSKAL